jgi:hypothetical protein
MRVASRWLPASAAASSGETSHRRDSALTISPAASSASLSSSSAGAHPSVLSLRALDSDSDSAQASSPRGGPQSPPARAGGSGDALGLEAAQEVFDSYELHTAGRYHAQPASSAGGLSVGAPLACATPPSGSLPSGGAESSSLGRASSEGAASGGDASAAALRRRCQRLERQRDEARAEAFAEASAAVQRGIEVENLSE